MSFLGESEKKKLFFMMCSDFYDVKYEIVSTFLLYALSICNLFKQPRSYALFDATVRVCVNLPKV